MSLSLIRMGRGGRSPRKTSGLPPLIGMVQSGLGAIKALNKADDLLDVAHAATKFDDAVDAARAAGKFDEAVDAARVLDKGRAFDRALPEAFRNKIPASRFCA